MFVYFRYMEEEPQGTSVLDVPSLLREIHHRVEAIERKRITHEEMASRLGISKRTYVEYLRGTNRPKGLSVMFQLLQMLDHEDLLRIIRPVARLSEPQHNESVSLKTVKSSEV